MVVSRTVSVGPWTREARKDAMESREIRPDNNPDRRLLIVTESLGVGGTESHLHPDFAAMLREPVGTWRRFA